MSQKINTGVGAMILIVISLTVGVFVWKYYQLSPIPESNNLIQGLGKKELVACTMEAKLCPDGSYVSRSGPNCEFAACPEITGIENKIIIISPKKDEAISSPVKILGKAVGGWFFEGSFPVSVHDDSGKVLARGIAEFAPAYPSEEWMTENFVNFEAEVKFSAPETPAGHILFTKDNPSGKPELDESFKLPVKFGNSSETSDWQTYRNQKYGFEFKYPTDYILEKPTPGEDVLIIRIPQKQEYMQIQFIASEPESELGYQPLGASFVENVLIGGKEAKKYYTQNPDKLAGVLEGYPFTDYVIKLNNNLRFYTSYYGDKDIAESFEKIISTFKFIK